MNPFLLIGLASMLLLRKPAAPSHQARVKQRGQGHTQRLRREAPPAPKQVEERAPVNQRPALTRLRPLRQAPPVAPVDMPVAPPVAPVAPPATMPASSAAPEAPKPTRTPKQAREAFEQKLLQPLSDEEEKRRAAALQAAAEEFSTAGSSVELAKGLAKEVYAKLGGVDSDWQHHMDQWSVQDFE